LVHAKSIENFSRIMLKKKAPQESLHFLESIKIAKCEDFKGKKETNSKYLDEAALYRDFVCRYTGCVTPL